MGKYIGHILVARPKPDNTFWTVSTISPKGIFRFWSCNKAVAIVFPHKAEPSSAARTGQYFLDCLYCSAVNIGDIRKFKMR